MTPVSLHHEPFKPARTGIGWLVQILLPGSSPPGKHAPSAGLFFPAVERQPAAEVLVASLVVASWSLIASCIVCLRRECFPGMVWLNGLTGIVVWIATLHLVILLPGFVLPLLGRLGLSLNRAATLVELSFHTLLILTAVHLTSDSHSAIRMFGALWIALALLDAGLRLLRSGISLARRQR